MQLPDLVAAIRPIRGPRTVVLPELRAARPGELDRRHRHPEARAMTQEQSALRDGIALAVLSHPPAKQDRALAGALRIYIAALRAEWPDLGDASVVRNSAALCRAVCKRISEIEAAGGRQGGTA